MYIFLQTYTFKRLGPFEDLRRLHDVKMVSQNKFDLYLQFIFSFLGVATIPLFFLLVISLRKQNSFILIPQVLSIWGTKWIDRIKRKYGVNQRFYLAIFDSMEASSPSMLAVKSTIESVKWDAVFTFDKEDAKNYGWEWLGFHYFSSPHFPHLRNNTTIIDKNIIDAYFIGGLKGGRSELIMELANYLTNNGVICLFDLYTYGQAVRGGDNKYIHYLKKWKRYTAVQKEVQNANVIIEILQDNQHCQSYRYFEAIFYNKKLLTNNINVRYYPFYDERYIKIIDDICAIDIEWIKRKEYINYGYNGEFSPIHFLEQIKEQEKQVPHIPK